MAGFREYSTAIADIQIVDGVGSTRALSNFPANRIIEWFGNPVLPVNQQQIPGSTIRLLSSMGGTTSQNIVNDGPTPVSNVTTPAVFTNELGAGNTNFTIHIVHKTVQNWSGTGSYRSGEDGSHVIIVNNDTILTNPANNAAGGFGSGEAAFPYINIDGANPVPNFTIGQGDNGRLSDVSAGLEGTRSIQQFGGSFNYLATAGNADLRWSVGTMEDSYASIVDTVDVGNAKLFYVYTQPGARYIDSTLNFTTATIGTIPKRVLWAFGGATYENFDTRGSTIQVADTGRVIWNGLLGIPNTVIAGFNAGNSTTANGGFGWMVSLNPTITVPLAGDSTSLFLQRAPADPNTYNANQRFVEAQSFVPTITQAVGEGAEGCLIYSSFGMTFANTERFDSVNGTARAETYTIGTNGNIAGTANYNPLTGIDNVAIPAAEGLRVPVAIYRFTGTGTSTGTSVNQISPSNSFRYRSLFHTIPDGEEDITIDKSFVDNRASGLPHDVNEFLDSRNFAVDNTVSPGVRFSDVTNRTQRTLAASISQTTGALLNNTSVRVQEIYDYLRAQHTNDNAAITYPTPTGTTSTWVGSIILSSTAAQVSLNGSGFTAVVTVPSNAIAVPNTDDGIQNIDLVNPGGLGSFFYGGFSIPSGWNFSQANHQNFASGTLDNITIDSDAVVTFEGGQTYTITGSDFTGLAATNFAQTGTGVVTLVSNDGDDAFPPALRTALNALADFNVPAPVVPVVQHAVVLNIPTGASGFAAIRTVNTTTHTATITNGAVTWTGPNLDANGNPQFENTDTATKTVFYKLNSTLGADRLVYRVRTQAFTTLAGPITIEPLAVNTFFFAPNQIANTNISITFAASTAALIQGTFPASAVSSPSTNNRDYQTAVVLACNSIAYFNWIVANGFTIDYVDYQPGSVVMNASVSGLTPPNVNTGVVLVSNESSNQTVVIDIGGAYTRQTAATQPAVLYVATGIRQVLNQESGVTSLATVTNAVAGSLSAIENKTGFLVENRLGNKGISPYDPDTNYPN